MSDLISDLDVVALLRDLPDEGLERGETGTVVLTHGSGEAFEVEFIRYSSASHPIIATIRSGDLLKLKGYKHVHEPLPA
jgi:hypothetical protein